MVETDFSNEERDRQDSENNEYDLEDDDKFDEDEFNGEEFNEDDFDEDSNPISEVKKTPNDYLNEEIKAMEDKIQALESTNSEDRFPRSETKTDFASGIINSKETKKIANLEEDEIYDLLQKRKFYNFLKYFGWKGLAERIISNVRDVEDYSLSRSARLLDSVFIDRTRNEAKNIQEERRGKR